MKIKITKYSFLFPIMLTTMFATAKLLGVISWPWWAVLSPLLMLLGLYAFMIAIIIFAVYFYKWMR